MTAVTLVLQSAAHFPPLSLRVEEILDSIRSAHKCQKSKWHGSCTCKTCQHLPCSQRTHHAGADVRRTYQVHGEGARQIGRSCLASWYTNFAFPERQSTLHRTTLPTVSLTVPTTLFFRPANTPGTAGASTARSSLGAAVAAAMIRARTQRHSH